MPGGGRQAPPLTRRRHRTGVHSRPEGGVLSSIVPQQIESSFLNQRTIHQSRLFAKVGNVQLTWISLRDGFVDLIEKVTGFGIFRRGDSPDNDILLHAFMMFMAKVWIAPATRTQLLEVFRMRIDNGVFVQLGARFSQSAGFVLRAREIEELVVLPDQGRQMRKDGDLVVAVGMIGDWRPVYQDDIAVVDAQILI